MGSVSEFELFNIFFCSGIKRSTIPTTKAFTVGKKDWSSGIKRFWIWKKMNIATCRPVNLSTNNGRDRLNLCLSN